MKYVNGKYKDEKIIFGGIGGKVDNETLGLYIQNGNQKIKVEKIITNDNERNTKNFLAPISRRNSQTSSVKTPPLRTFRVRE